ncbi:hypothetical protein MJO29_003338 [Puccinia striiformis f. sp. tritici]|nr:hypothetical protein MJO29_003338 [Puccinia striiformis f. sp. tritici]
MRQTTPVQILQAAAPSNPGAIKAVVPVKPKAKPPKKRQHEQPSSKTDNATQSNNEPKKPPKRKPRKSVSGTTEVGSNGETYDYNQDTDHSSAEDDPEGQEDEFPHPSEYFHEGVWKEGDVPGTALNFKCKWCHNTYCGQELSSGNLKTHRDGSTQVGKNPKGCINREHAKKAGILLPPTVAERRALAATKTSDANQTIRQALPWTRTEDPCLRAAFKFANPKAVLYGWQWSADESKKLYAGLKRHVFEELHNLDTKFTLIHDVWTTKGNRLAFIGAAIAYTTDSGSNNNTMALEMYELINNNDPSNSSVLGFFPVLGRLTEEDTPKPLTSEPTETTEIEVIGDNNVEEIVRDSDSNYGNADDKGSDVGDDSESNNDNIIYNKPNSNKHVKSTKLLVLTTKRFFASWMLSLNKIQIMRPAAQRSKFTRISQELRLNVAPLIAGYGICWNIKFQSYKKAVAARDVIDQIIKEDQGSNRDGGFGDAHFSTRDWNKIENLNKELEVFVELTSYMEGNSATGAHVIPKYLKLKESISEKLARAQEKDSLYPMYHAMLKRVDRYLDKAMGCSTLVLATLMHPCYRMNIFELAFGTKSSEVTTCLSLLKHKFHLVKDAQSSAEKVTDPDITVGDKPCAPEPTSLMAWLASRMKQKPTPQENEIDAYLNVNIAFKKGAIDHKTTPLEWWKVNQATYPTLAVMAWAYLGAPGSSCSVERLFWAASDRNGLQNRTPVRSSGTETKENNQFSRKLPRDPLPIGDINHDTTIRSCLDFEAIKFKNDLKIKSIDLKRSSSRNWDNGKRFKAEGRTME